MASNALFSCFRGKKFSYSPQERNIHPKPVNLLRIGSMDKPPAPKKRKMENEEPFWDDDDDDFELTQKDLETIDNEVMASQLSVNNNNNAMYKPTASDPGPSGAALSMTNVPKYPSAPGRMTERSQSSFLKPKPVNVSLSSSESPRPQSSTSGSRHSTSLSSSESPRPQLLMSGNRHSNSSVSSEEMPLRPPSRKGSTSLHSMDTNDQSLTTEFLRNPIVEAEIEKYRQQCHNLQKELESARYTNEGRIKILQSNLTKKDAELGEIRQERARFIEQQRKEQTEKEKNLQSEVEKLTTQLQFKDRELDNFRERCRTLESHTSTSGPSVSPVRSPRISSPIVKRQKLEEKSPKGKPFPTSQSFLAEDVPSTSRGSYRAVEMKDEGTMAITHSDTRQQNSGRSRQFTLKLRCPQGNVSGVELLADLLDADLSTERSGDERGIVGLLQKFASAVDLQSLHFDRDSSSLLSPIPNKRLLELKRQQSLLLSPEKPVRKPIISPDSYSSAIHGMKCLLRNQQTFQSRTEIGVVLTDTTLNGAILFLPMIDDYLTQYIDMLHSSLDSRSSFTSSGSSKSSFDSSIESLTSSLDTLLKDSADFANNLESMALLALHVVHKLVSFSPVIRNILLNVETVVRPLEDTTDEGETDESSPASTVSEKSDWSITSQKIIDLQILRKIIKIADCGHKERWYNSRVVEKCFDILIVLSNNATEVQLESLKPETIGRVLVNALECRTDKQVMISALNLISTLVQYNKIVSSLCVCTEGCILQAVYQMCTELINTENDDDVIIVICKLVLEILYTILSVHKGGIVLLLESDCSCSVKVIQTIVLLVHKFLTIYENSLNQEILDIMMTGLQLLHTMSQRQYDFVDKHYQVEHQYVRFVCDLTKVLKDLPGSYEQELIALADLWDFNQDDSELSQESDEEPLQEDPQQE